MFVERVDRIEDLRPLKSAWETAYRRDPEATFFLSWRWLADVLGSNPGEWIVLVARSEAGEPVGFLPLQSKTVWSKRRRRLRNEVHFAGRLFWSDYGGVLALPEHEDEAVPALAVQLKRMSWSHMYLKGFRSSDRRFELFMGPFADDRLIVEARTSFINEGETDNLVCPYVDLPGSFADYLKDKLSANMRQKVRRFLRKLESSPDYEITTASAATRSRDLQILEEFWCSKWESQYGEETRRHAARYRMILEHGLQDGTVHMPVLWHRGLPVGVLASYIDRDKSRLLFFLGGRREEFRDLPVGLVLHVLNIRWAIENGIETYDFLRGNEPYKFSLGAETARLRYPSVRTRTGVNLNGELDPGCIDKALRLAREYAAQELGQETATICRQVLSTSPGNETATRLLSSLAGAG